MPRLRRIWRWWPAAVVATVALLIYAAWPGSSKYSISAETTYVTGPVDAEGVVDFQTALNERLSKGVPPESNANVLLWQALGPKPEGGRGMPPDYFRWLGVPAPPDDGEYFIGTYRYFEKHIKDRPEPDRGRFWLWPVEELDDFETAFPPDRNQEWGERISRTGRRPWTAADEPDVADWVKANEKPLAVVADAVRRPAYFNPLVGTDTNPRAPRLIGALLPNVQTCRQIGQALACRAMNRTAGGDYDGAWRDLLTAQRLGRHLSHGGTLIEYLVGVAVVQIATNSQLTLLSHTAHPADRIRAWQADLRALPPVRGTAESFLTERFMCLDSLQSITHTGTNGLDALNGPSKGSAGNPVTDRLFTRSIDWDPAFRNTNRMFDRAAAAAAIPDRAARQAEFAAIETEIKDRRSAVMERSVLGRMTLGKAERGEMIGDILLGLLFPALAKIQATADRTEQTQANLHLAFALAAYRAETGHYPATLNELAPKYISKVPGDVFSGKPLIYRVTGSGYLLYSVGANEVDDGGRWIDDDPKGDDPRVRMPVTDQKVKPKPPPDPIPELAPRGGVE